MGGGCSLSTEVRNPVVCLLLLAVSSIEKDKPLSSYATRYEEHGNLPVVPCGVLFYAWYRISH